MTVSIRNCTFDPFAAPGWTWVFPIRADDKANVEPEYVGRHRRKDAEPPERDECE